MAIYCGSASGRDPVYLAAARAAAAELHRRGMGMVYGGASVGTMGAAADEMVKLGGECIGVLPRRLQARELGHQGLTQLHVVEDMHQRKMMMMTLSDGFITLPGGTGTLEELFEVWTWAQLGLHPKPVGLLNVNGYYDGLLTFLKHTATEGFMRGDGLPQLIVASELPALLDQMLAYVPPPPRWA